MNKKVLILLVLVLSFAACKSQDSAKSDQSQKDIEAIKQVIESYKESINLADTTLAVTFWSTTPEVSVIHPRGHEKGWDEIKFGIYEMFGTRFSTRDLKTYNELITIYDNMAVVIFYWIFDATYSGENPTQMQSKGRETQIMEKIGNEWKIVHVHYSGMPQTGEREGF